MYESFKTKSLRPFLISDRSATQLETDYANIMLWWDLVQNGNLMKVTGISDQEFDKRLETLTTKVKGLIGGAKSFEKKLLSDKFMKLLTIKNDFITLKISSGVRKAPFTLELFGESSQGKTTFGDQLIDALLVSAGLPIGKQYRATYNPADPFMSNWTTDKLVMTVDDVANEKGGTAKSPPTRVFVDVCNNQPYYANVAHLEGKGKIFVEPCIMMANTNKKDVDAALWSNCPYSIQRRFHYVIMVEAKKEFQFIVDDITQGIDSEKVKAFNKSLGRDPVFDDIWYLTVEKAVKPEKLHQVATYRTVVHNGVPLKNVSFKTVMNFLIERFHKHEEEQNDIVEKAMNRQHQVVRCPHPGCKFIKGYCDLHPEAPNLVPADENDDDDDPGSPFSLFNWFRKKKQDEKVLEDKVESFICGEVTLEPPPEEPPDTKKKKKKKFKPTIAELPPIEEEKVDFDKQSGEDRETGDILYDGISRATGIIADKVTTDLFGMGAAVEGAASLALLTSAKMFARHWDWLSIIPSSWVNNSYFKKAMMIMDYNKIKKRYVFRSSIMWLGSFATIGLLGLMERKFQHEPLVRRIPFVKQQSLALHAAGAILPYCAIRQSAMVKIVSQQYRQELLQRNELGVAPSLKLWRDTHAPTIFKAAGIVGSLYLLAKVYRRWVRMEPQGSLEPKTEEDIAKRDKEENPWTEYASITKRQLPLTPKSVCTSPKDMQNVVDKNLVYVTVGIDEERVLMANALFTRSNVAILPSHYFENEEIICTFRKEKPNDCGGKFTCPLSVKKSVRIPGKDIMVCYVPNGGSFADISDRLPKENMPEHQFTLMWRKKSGEMRIESGRAKPGIADNGVCRTEGGVYANLSFKTFDGLCGATLISHGGGSCVSGIHLGGEAKTPNGCYGVLTLDEYRKAEEMLRELDGVVLSGSAWKFDKQSLSVNFGIEGEVHPKSPLHWMPPNSQIEYYGRCMGQTTSKTDVKVTKISHLITEVMNEPNIWRPPKLKPEWYGWQKCLSNMANPARSFSPDLLDLAILDYKESLEEIFRSDIIGEVKPLSDEENILGVQGKKFLDAIKMATSIGYPLTGPKRNFIIEKLNKDGTVTRDFIPLVWEEITRCVECYKKGWRAYTVSKGCKKDEILAKEKCRIFFGNPIALTFLIRRYFLPLIRVLQLFPLKSECAVGINSHGPEWEELDKFVRKYKHLIGGDYGKYDQKLPAQLIFAALRILIDMAKICGYSEEDIRIMEAMTGDIVFAMIAFNGDLIGLTEGSHISGNSLTVIINGICGSLNLRCAFYSLYAPKSFDERIPFREVVALITYGDDNMGSVKEGFEDFNIRHISKFLEKYGQTYTMPDKESELVPFLVDEDYEFLKRVSRYCPKKGATVGALLEKSIFKMLHCYMYSKKKCGHTEEWACAQNIDSALREWENHGEEIYERRRAQLKEVCSKIPVVGSLCLRLDTDYDTCVEEWKDKYHSGYEKFSNPEDPLPFCE
jgi:hypothetical protein